MWTSRLATTKRPNCYSKSCAQLWDKKAHIVKKISTKWRCYPEICYETFHGKGGHCSTDSSMPSACCNSSLLFENTTNSDCWYTYIHNDRTANVSLLYMWLPEGGGDGEWREWITFVVHYRVPEQRKGENYTTTRQTRFWSRHVGTMYRQLHDAQPQCKWLCVSLLWTHYANGLAHALASYNTALLSSSIIWHNTVIRSRLKVKSI